MENVIDINRLKLTQMYLSQKKIDDVLSWFDISLHNFEPICVRDFLNNGDLHITDGHTRAFVAWGQGIEKVPCAYDESEIVVCELGQKLYKTDIEWCDRFQLTHIADLKDRILSETEYEKLWRERCAKKYNLQVALIEGRIYLEALKRKIETLARKGLFIYGISEKLDILYAEDILGKLFEIAYHIT